MQNLRLKQSFLQANKVLYSFKKSSLETGMF